MHVAYCFDRAYEQHFVASAWSLLLNWAGGDLTVHVVTDVPSEALLGAVERLRRVFKARFEIYRLQADALASVASNPTQSQETKHLSSAAYWRLLLPDVLPASVYRVLYLDADTIIMGDVSELAAFDLGGAAVAAVRDNADGVLRQAGHTDYVNSGVMLLDLGQWRRRGLAGTISRFAQTTDKLILFADQCCLNWVLADERAFLPAQWNRYIMAEDADLDISGAKILHFVTGEKPWQSWYRNPLGKHYWTYLDASGWKAEPVPPVTLDQHHNLAKRLTAERDYLGAIAIYEQIRAYLVGRLQAPR